MRWCASVAAALAGAADRVGRLAHGIVEDWRDPRGQEWAQRVALLHRELGRAAAEAAELGTALAHGCHSSTAAANDLPRPAPLPVRGATPARDRGPRLGAVAGDRAEHDLGMGIAELPG
jgi:hypothetical protein